MRDRKRRFAALARSRSSPTVTGQPGFRALAAQAASSSLARHRQRALRALCLTDWCSVRVKFQTKLAHCLSFQ